MEILNKTEVPQRSRSLANVLAAIALIITLLYFGRIFFITLVTAVLLSFILEPVVVLFMRLRLPRGPASFLACSLSLLLLYGIGMGVYTQALGLAEEIPVYSRRINDLVDSATVQVEALEKSATELLVPKRLREPAAPPQQAAQPTKDAAAAAARKRRSVEPPLPLPPAVQEVRIRQDRSAVVAWIYDNLGAFYDALLMASFIPFLIYFMLSWRDHFRRTWLNLFEGEKRDLAQKAWSGIAVAARAYVVGNFLLGVLLSLMSCVFFYFVRLPYWQLVGPISGFLSLVPYIGLPLAIVPPFFAALPVYGQLAPYLLIGTTTALFHLLALNLLYPKLVGSRVHLNPLSVTVALMFWYLLWGGAGLILAIPVTAGLKAVLDNIPSLRGYGRLLGD
jgi:predicted PurR-regulated permease PerM